MDFNSVKTAVAKQFERMQKLPMFRAELDKEELWQTYLGGFLPGTDPVHKTRTEHNCTCCRHFIREVGDAVAVDGEVIVSLWDVQASEYQPVVDAMSKFVKSHPIGDVFLHPERTAGTDRSFQQLTERVQTWTHFHVHVESRHVLRREDIPTKLSELRSTRDAFLRSLTEVSDDSLETVLDLVAQNSLYRGEENRGLLVEFRRLKAEYAKLSPVSRVSFLWAAQGAVARIRGSAIGTLLQDLSEGKEIDDAVRAYESKVAPMNYKRPTALITRAMIAKARATIEELGLTSALERRYATLADVSINDLVFANRGTRRAITGSPLDDIMPTASAGSFDRVEEIRIEKFIAEVVPRVESIEVMLENRLAPNMVSLIAPADATAKQLFKWDNRFSWAYSGDVADSIRERVKKAGGCVVADLCCRLAWRNYDDLDLHLLAPDGHIFFGQKYVGGGQLDVDMNAGRGQTREAVENIFYQARASMMEGTYKLYVHQYQRRETVDVGFEVELDYLGEVRSFAYERAVTGEVLVAKFKYTHGGGLEILESLPSSQVARTVWGLTTGSFHQVSALTLSPNHWGGRAAGNKHYLFFLEGCRNDGSARGFFNEFLRTELDRHRKVLEVVGSKLRTDVSESQLSGLGFSSTQENSMVCRVRGSFSRTLKIKF